MEAWRVQVSVLDSLPDPRGEHAAAALRAVGLEPRGPVRSISGYLLPGSLGREQVTRIARELLADPVTEHFAVLAPGEVAGALPGLLLTVCARPGVMDPAAGSVLHAVNGMGIPVDRVATCTSYLLAGLSAADAPQATRAARRTIANEVIHEILVGRVPASIPETGTPAPVRRTEVGIIAATDERLAAISRDGGLSLSIAEMRAIRDHFASLARNPTDVEIETIAQTWSEHCKHKTLRGRIEFEGRVIDNLLAETIVRVTEELARPWCVSVFEDNAGVIDFDGEDCVAIKVETHNHPSAIDPAGGAGTGVGGVIRDVLGTGLGARPIASTDVFCVAPPDLPDERVPRGCLHPRRVLTGVVAGVRDYGNPMGIPTVNGSIHFDEDFVGNPLVYCGNIGIIPRSRVRKASRPGDLIVVAGGRTGRDGIHGATFSSAELHEESERVSSGAVQIGDPITEKKLADAVLQARDEDLFTAITDCGAGGLSSAVGEMGEHCGAEVELERVPLKYEGLASAEVWISEAQERMVLAVPPERLDRFLAVCAAEEVEASVIGRFAQHGKLVIRHGGLVVADLSMRFLHGGLPRLTRAAEWIPPPVREPDLPPPSSLGDALLRCLSDFGVASKEWVIRQYDHEVQAGSAVKPLCGALHDGPSDAAVVAPKLGSLRGIVVGNGLNPRYSKIDPAAMAECALDEAMRNVVAAGGDPSRTAVLDNYCWGNTEKPDRLGGLVRASFALRDVALCYGTPFVSGKDSLNNEYRTGERSVAIPGCILVTAISVIPDVTRAITTDLKGPGHALYLVGVTKSELGGSVYYKTRGELGASVPRVDARVNKRGLDAVARALASGAALACHDLSEGGLGVAAAEMAIAGRTGVRLDLASVPAELGQPRDDHVLFSESTGRFLIECASGREADLEANLEGVVSARVGATLDAGRMRVTGLSGATVIDLPLPDLVRAWQDPLALDAASGRHAPGGNP